MARTEHDERLATAIRARLEALGMSQSGMAEDSAKLDPRGKGLSIRTINGLCTGHFDPPSPRTRGLVEAVLGWPSGAVADILEGGDVPQPERRDSTARIAELAEEVAELRAMLAQIAKAFGQFGDGQS